MKHETIKVVVAICLAVILLAVVTTFVHGFFPNSFQCPPPEKITRCIPGWPSGWWDRNCYGETGGWAAINAGCPLR